jgi:cytochrome c oxidase subunit 2
VPVEPTTPTRRQSRKARAPALLAAALPAALATGCGTIGFPDSATGQGDEITWLWRIVVVIAALVTLLIWGLTAAVIVASVRRRRSEGRDAIPEQHQYRTLLEMGYTAVPLFIVMGILALTFVVTQRVTANERPELTVGVIGFQWQWQFTYADRNLRINGDADTLPELWLPVGRRVKFEVSSPDVIHSFWVPEFLEKRDMIPGTTNVVDVTVKRPGQWVGRCAEYCGFDHWRMKFAVCAVDGATFDAWVTEQSARPQPVVSGVPVDASTTAPAGGPTRCPSPPEGGSS